MSNALDLFLRSVEDMQRAEVDAQEWAEAAAHVQELQARLRAIEEDNAANIAEKCALRQQLARYAPKHPLLTSKALREKVQDTGARAFLARRNFDDAREAGEKYFGPGEPPIEGTR